MMSETELGCDPTRVISGGASGNWNPGITRRLPTVRAEHLELYRKPISHYPVMQSGNEMLEARRRSEVGPKCEEHVTCRKVLARERHFLSVCATWSLGYY